MLDKIIQEHESITKSFPFQNIRQQAFKRLKEQSLPDKNHEEWRFLPINSKLLNQNFDLKNNKSSIDFNDIKKYILQEDSHLIVFVNGFLDINLSKLNETDFVVTNFSKALQNTDYKNIIESFLNSSQNNNEHFFTLNTSFFSEGTFIYLNKNIKVEKPIQILHISDQKDVFLSSRNLIVVEKNSEVKIVEKHVNISDNQNFTNSVTEIFIDDNSQVDYYKVQNDSYKSNIIDTTSITQKRDTLSKVHTFSFGGNITRNTLSFFQKGENSNSVLNGITLTNENQTVDHHTLVDHFVPNCESHQLYRGIFDGNSKGIFNGKIIVDREAQKTNAFQQNNNLLLSDSASINTKPQLEIFADDVKCSHGCTVGQLDENSLFYLQTRGIPKKEAKALLTLAFSTDVLEQVEIEKIKNATSKIIAEKLGVNLDLNF